MTLALNLTPEQEEALRRKAAQAGSDERVFALTLLSEALGVVHSSSALQSASLQSSFDASPAAGEWVKSWHQWTHSHSPDVPVLLDDSRESIYED